MTERAARDDTHAVLGIRYEDADVWVDVCGADGVHSALAPPGLDPRRVGALERVAEAAQAVSNRAAQSGEESDVLDALDAALDALPTAEVQALADAAATRIRAEVEAGGVKGALGILDELVTHEGDDPRERAALDLVRVELGAGREDRNRS